MATVTGLTAERMQEIIDSTIVDADVVGDNLILTKDDGSTIDAGNVRGNAGIGKGPAFPVAPTDGDLWVRTDQVGDPLYKYTDGVWLVAAGGLQKVTSFPVAPTDGDGVVRTDLNGSPIFMYSTENGWEQQPRMGAVTVPSVRANGSSSITIPTNTQVNLSFGDADTYDTDNMHDPAVNNHQIVIRTPGLYLITGSVYWAGGGGGMKEVIVNINGATGFGSDEAAPTAANTHRFAGQVRLAAGDIITVDAWTNVGSSVTGRRIEVAWLGGFGQTIDERGVPAAKATRLSAGTQTIANGTQAVIALPTEDYDTDGMHDPAVNNSRLTIKTPGLYRLLGYVGIDNTGTAYLTFYVNGVSIADPSPTNQFQGQDRGLVSAEVMLNAGDYVELSLQNNTGSIRTIVRSFLSASLVGSGKAVTPFARAHHNANQSIPNSTTTVLALNSELVDNDGIHDTATNNSRLTCRTAGVYDISAAVTFDSSGSGHRQLMLRVNGTTLINVVRVPAVTAVGTESSVEISAQYELAVGDYVELLVMQNSGGALNAMYYGNYAPFLSMVKVGAPNAPGFNNGAQADVYTIATLPAATAFPNGKIVGVSDGAAGQQARMSMNGAWINLG